MQNLKVEMKPIVSMVGGQKDTPIISFKMKIEVSGSAVECEDVIKYLQTKGAILSKGDKAE